jgi:dihydroxyacetone kinase DhaKLM complex PTS-EIIA-like component DhaM
MSYRVVLRMMLFLTTLLMLYVLSIGGLTYLPVNGASIIERSLEYGLRPGARGHSLARFREVEHYGNVDILLAGSSHAMRGFDTRCFAKAGLRAFNLGSTSQSPLNSYYLFERYWTSLNPRFVIYDVFPRIFRADGVESFFDIAANTALSTETVAMAFATRNMATVNALVSLEWERLAHPLDQARQRFRDETYVSGGYVEQSSSRAPNVAIKPHEWEVSGRQEEYFRRLLRFVQARDAQIILVSLPISSELREKVTNFDDIMARIHKLAEAEDVVFIDLNSAVSLDSSQHFLDDDHLNAEGVRLTNGVLLGILEQRFGTALRTIPSYRQARAC